MVLPNGGTGGMQAQVHLVSASLAERGYVVSVFVGGLEGNEVRDGISYIAAPAFFERRGWDFLRQLRRTVKDLSPDVVHGHGLRTGPLVALSGGKTKRFVTCHGIDPDAVSTPLLNALRVLPVKVLSCGPGPQRILAEHGFDSSLLENAAPPAAESKSRDEFNTHFGVTDSDFVALWPARFSKQKNHVALLEFAEQLRDTPVVIVCCGDGPLRSQFDDEIANRDLSRHIRTFDYVEHAGSWLEASDFFVLPSRWEGQPLILIEAMRAGLPSLTWTPVGAELLDSSLHFRGPDEAALEVRNWMSSPEARAIVPTGFDSIVKSHEIDITISRYIDLYYS